MLPPILQNHLNRQQAVYVIEPCTFTQTRENAAAGDRALDHVARAVALADERGIVIAVLPADRLLDVDALRHKLGRALYPLTAARTQTLFQDCEQPAWPPFAAAYGQQAVIDISLYSQLVIRVAAGRRDVLLGLSVQEFQRLMGDAVLGRFSAPMPTGRAQTGTPAETTPFAQQAAAAIASCRHLPVLPDSALAIFKLTTDPHAGVRDLAKIIELDSALSANILRYANSPFYGYPGKITDVQNAIARVLGFDKVLGLAIGMSIGRSFRIPTEGALGLNAYRRNAVYCATLAQKLAQKLAGRPYAGGGVHAGTAYTAGLLHNVGQLFIGHVFPHEYARLECALLANTHAAMPDVEQNFLGIGHDEIAADLLRAWRLPDSIITAARHHHDPGYQGSHAVYARLTCIANRALASYGLGINEPDRLPSDVLHSLGLSEDCVRETAAAIWEARADMEILAQLVA